MLPLKLSFVFTIPYGSLETLAWWENEKCYHPQLHSLSMERSGRARPPDHVSPSVIYPQAILVASSPVWLLLIGLTTFGSFFLQHLCNKSYNLETINQLLLRHSEHCKKGYLVIQAEFSHFPEGCFSCAITDKTLGMQSMNQVLGLVLGTQKCTPQAVVLVQSEEIFTYRISYLLFCEKAPKNTLEGSVKDKAGTLALGGTMVSTDDAMCAMKQKHKVTEVITRLSSGWDSWHGSVQQRWPTPWC